MEWECFGESSDDENDDTEPARVRARKDDATVSTKLGQTVFIKLMSLSPVQRVRGTDEMLQPEIGILSGDDPNIALVHDRLKKSGFKNVRLQTAEELEGLYMALDVVVDVVGSLHASESNDQERSLRRALVPGGLLVSTVTSTQQLSPFPSFYWATDHAQTERSADNVDLVCIRTRSALPNIQACSWKKGSKTSLQKEMDLLDAVTVRRSRAECESGCLSEQSHTRAVQCLREHGLLILRAVFTAESSLAWGAAALADLDLSSKVLADKGIDIASSPVNYHELGMREDFRMDLRHCPNMSAMERTMALQSAAGNGQGKSTALQSEEQQQQQQQHCLGVVVDTQLPMIHSVLQEVCNPMPADAAVSMGNWGRWNFGGAGPNSAAAPLAVAAPAAVISLPGCADQAVHADTPHLYEHVELPPHYLNMFLPALDTSSADISLGHAVGQTAFLVGSHRLKTAAALMSSSGHLDRSLIDSSLVRPHCQPGDVILFDCRILHFGLANSSHKSAGSAADEKEAAAEKGVRRPMIYVNYHQPWWARLLVDKNFEKERLFPPS
jgi:hypothetical protein